MSKTANKKVVCEKLIEFGKKDKDIVALTSDSRGSASMTDFGNQLPDQLVEVGIAEQNIVGMAAGLAAAGKKPFITSYAAFVTMRAIEQVKVDIAYSNVNVKIIGISGGVSYGPLGMSHHTLHDIAVMRAIPNIKMVMPADRYDTEKLMKELVDYQGPVYVRVGRNPVEDVHQSADYEFKIGKADQLREGSDLTIIATGEHVSTTLKAAELLEKNNISCRVINMHTLKPLDEKAVIKAAEDTGKIVTVEEHSIYGGLGSAVSQVVAENHPVPVKVFGIPDEPAVTGYPEDIFKEYGLTPANIAEKAKEMFN